MPVITLKKHSQFMRVRGGRRVLTMSFLIECKPQLRGDAIQKCVSSTSKVSCYALNKSKHGKITIPTGPRFGFTVTKKMGNAVIRNRIRRRLKAAVSELAEKFADPSFDYVVLARKHALNCKFLDMKNDMQIALSHLHKPQIKCSGKPQQRPHRRRSNKQLSKLKTNSRSIP